MPVKEVRLFYLKKSRPVGVVRNIDFALFADK